MQANEHDIEHANDGDGVLDAREQRDLDVLTKRYEKLCEPGPIAKAGRKAVKLIPSAVKDQAGRIGHAISEQELYQQAMDVVAKGFKVLEQQAARLTVTPGVVVRQVNEVTDGIDIEAIDDVCMARSYDIARLVNAERGRNLLIAAAEGGATGAAGFAGIPFNLALSTFCYYRAVQSIALYYGFDTKNDAEELVIAGEVLTQAMDPGHGSGEMGSVIGKIMLLSEVQTVKEAVRKGWAAAAARGGIPLVIAQLRALAHQSAKKALEKTGQKGLENSVFRSVFEQIGKRLTQKTVSRAIPVVSGIIGAAFDTAQMDKIVAFADIFYQKRFILEKQMRQELRATSKHDVPDSQTTGADNEENTSPLDENEANGAVGHDGDCMMAVDASVEAD